MRRASPPSPGAGPAERRRSERRSSDATGWLGNASGGSMSAGRFVAIHDLSLHGVGFRSERSCAVGAVHWLLINRGPMRLSTRLRIVTCRELQTGEWDVGAEFF